MYSEGTREGHLKSLAKREIEPESIARKEKLEREREEMPLAKTREKRTIKKVERLTY